MRQLAGEVVAEFVADVASTVSEAAGRVAELGPPRLRRHRRQLLHRGEVLNPERRLGEALGGAASAELTVCLEPVVELTLRNVLGATMLSASGDLVVATTGALVPGAAAPTAALGTDNGAHSPYWFWRLPAAEAWEPAAATLLARLHFCPRAALQEPWVEACQQVRAEWEGRASEFEVKMKSQFGAEPDRKDYWRSNVYPRPQVEAWLLRQDQEASAGGEAASEAPFPEVPERGPKGNSLSLHAHDDRFVVFGWNGDERVYNQGHVERLDTESGEIASISRSVCHVWGVTTDPRDGRVFCVTCCSSWAVAQLRGESTVLEPRPGAVEKEVLAEDFGAGELGLAFDAVLGALVTSDREGELRLVCPPDSEALATATAWLRRQAEARAAAEGASSRAEDAAPGEKERGDRAAGAAAEDVLAERRDPDVMQGSPLAPAAGEPVPPWTVVRLRPGSSLTKREMPAFAAALSSHGGRVTRRCCGSRRAVESFELGGGGGAEGASIVRARAPIVAATGAIGAEQPLVLLFEGA